MLAMNVGIVVRNLKVPQFRTFSIPQYTLGGTDEGRRFLSEYGAYGTVVPTTFWAMCYGAVMLPANIGIKFYKTELLR